MNIVQVNGNVSNEWCMQSILGVPMKDTFLLTKSIREVMTEVAIELKKCRREGSNMKKDLMMRKA